MWKKRQTDVQADRYIDRYGERETEGERERWRERENLNLKTLIYKDCSLGSVKHLSNN